MSEKRDALERAARVAVDKALGYPISAQATSDYEKESDSVLLSKRMGMIEQAAWSLVEIKVIDAELARRKP